MHRPGDPTPHARTALAGVTTTLCCALALAGWPWQAAAVPPLAAAARAAPPAAAPVHGDDAHIERWRGGRRAALSLTVDDGLPVHHETLAPLLAAHGLRATFYLTTARLDDDEALAPWRALAADGHEIGSHGHTHTRLDDLPPPQVEQQLRRSQERLRRALGPAHGSTFAYPFSVASPEARRLVSELYVAGRRVGARLADEASDVSDLPAFPWRSDTTAAQMDEVAEQALVAGGWAIELLHGVDGQGFQPVPAAVYARHFGHLQRRSELLWVAPLGEVARYLVQRRGASVATERQPDRLVVTLTAGEPLPPAPVPLTLSVPHPHGWPHVQATLDGEPLSLVPAGGGGARLLFDVVPREQPLRIELRPTRGG